MHPACEHDNVGLCLHDDCRDLGIVVFAGLARVRFQVRLQGEIRGGDRRVGLLCTGEAIRRLTIGEDEGDAGIG